MGKAVICSGGWGGGGGGGGAQLLGRILGFGGGTLLSDR